MDPTYHSSEFAFSPSNEILDAASSDKIDMNFLFYIYKLDLLVFKLLCSNLA
jgi:hypothetical protein